MCHRGADRCFELTHVGGIFHNLALDILQRSSLKTMGPRAKAGLVSKDYVTDVLLTTRSSRDKRPFLHPKRGFKQTRES